MSVFTVSNVKITGISACVPKNKIATGTYKNFSKEEKELFIKTTGIEFRRVAEAGVTSSDLCAKSAEELLRKLNWDRSEIETLVFVTQTPDYLIPCTSTILQDRLSLPKSCMTIDINLGCSGYVYGLATAASLISNTSGKKGLLLVGDIASRTVSEEDKSVAPIFSDAGSATALQHAEGENMHFNLQSDGSGYDAIITPDGGMKSPFSAHSLKMQQVEDGIKRNRLHTILNGVEVFNFSLREVAPNVRELLEYIDKSTDEIDYFVFHQANQLMNNAICRKLKFEKNKMPLSLKEFGNTSCATVPVTMVSELQNELENRSLSLVLSGFGVGLSWGSAVVNTCQIACPEMIEI